eukprot:327322-Hanusia_phi.AAC.1
MSGSSTDSDEEDKEMRKEREDIMAEGLKEDNEKLHLSLCTHTRRHFSRYNAEANTERPTAEEEEELLRNLPPPSGDRACWNVQVSFATDSAVTVTWRPPRNARGKDLFRYRMEFAEVPEPLKSPFPGEEQTGGNWKDIPNQINHAGHELGTLHSCSWVVTGLKSGSWVTLRVRVENCSHYRSWSPPSQAFCVGGRNFSAHGRGVGGDTWTAEESLYFRSLDSPEKVQDYLDSIPMNHEVDKDVSLSALECVSLEPMCHPYTPVSLLHA